MLQDNVRQSLIGFAFGSTGMVLLAGMDAVAKALGNALPVFELVLIRYWGATIVLSAYVLASGREWPSRKYLPAHILRGGLLAMTLSLFFYAATHLQLAVATALALVAPVYIAILGVVFLGEKLTRRVVGALALALAGAGVIILESAADGFSGQGNWLAWAAALGAPVTYAVGILILKRHTANEGPVTLALGQSAAAGVIILPLALPVFTVPAADQIGLCILLGVLGAIGGLFIIEGLRRLSASVYALLDYTALIWAALFGLIFFAEQPGLVFWLGSALIVAACLLGVSAQRQVDAIKTTGTPID